MNPSPLDASSNNPPVSRFWREWLGNSLQFPVLNILLEVLVSDPLYALIAPNLIGLLVASILQAWVLSRWQAMENPRRLLGNLIGPAIFTALGLSLTGPDFLQVPNHIAYWGFSLLFGLIQSIQTGRRQWLRTFLVLAESILRGVMVVVMNYILYARLDPTASMRIPDFLLDAGRLFIALATLMLGLNIGMANLSTQRALELAQEMSRRLKTYAAWLFGRDDQGQGLEYPATPGVKRQERIILVMNIRGFTRWSEARQPEETISLLNRYYQTVEATLNQYHAHKFQLRAAEVLAFFSRIDDELEAALKLRLQINALLKRQGLSAGIGLHLGPVVEGWMGGKDVKVMEIVGEAVNIARAIESDAGPGELLVSETMRIAIGNTFRAGPKRLAAIQERSEPMVIYPLE